MSKLAENDIKQEYYIVKETETEKARSGNFTRIFPAENAYFYKKFFDNDRPLNQILITYYSIGAI